MRNQNVMHLIMPTFLEWIHSMTTGELEQLATSEALAMADSSIIKGLTLDHDRIRNELLSGYQLIRSNAHPAN